MANTIQLVGRGPASNPDTLLFKVSYSGNYAGPELLNLAPVSGANPHGFTDPNLLGPPYLDTPPKISAEGTDDLGGAYTEFHLGTTLQNSALHVYSAGGTEATTGQPLPAGVLAGSTLLTVRIPQMQV
jgi:hypothetical protein